MQPDIQDDERVFPDEVLDHAPEEPEAEHDHEGRDRCRQTPWIARIESASDERNDSRKALAEFSDRRTLDEALQGRRNGRPHPFPEFSLVIDKQQKDKETGG